MYILIRIGVNGMRSNSMASKKKKYLMKHLKKKGYYWSEKYQKYIDDKTVKMKSGSGADYVIEEIDEI